MKIYLAGAFFNFISRSEIELAASILRARGFDVFVPMEHTIDGGEEMSNVDWGAQVFYMDVEAINRCDAVVSIYEGMTSDSGTAWEIGYAFALKKPIVCVHIDKRPASLMVTSSARVNLVGIESLRDYDFNLWKPQLYEGEVQ